MTKKDKTEAKNDQVEALPSAGGEAPEDGIGDRIRSARESRGLSQAALATRTKMMDSTGKGVARTVLLSYEAGNFRPGAREIRLICEALSVTPNWLVLGVDEASTQASMEAVRQKDLGAAIRLAMAISVLKPHERAALQSLALSLAGRQLGDMKLSAVMTIAAFVAREIEPRLGVWLGDGAAEASLDELVLRAAEGMQSNLGNKLVLDEDDPDAVAGEWLYKPPVA